MSIRVGPSYVCPSKRLCYCSGMDPWPKEWSDYHTESPYLNKRFLSSLLKWNKAQLGFWLLITLSEGWGWMWCWREDGTSKYKSTIQFNHHSTIYIPPHSFSIQQHQHNKSTQCKWLSRHHKSTKSFWSLWSLVSMSGKSGCKYTLYSATVPLYAVIIIFPKYT